MNKISRTSLVIIVTLGITILGSMTVFAGTWKSNTIGWWYQNNDGIYMANQWFKDSNGQWYHFNQEGYIQTGWIFDNGQWYYLGLDGAMYEDIRTPDGYTIGTDGAWIEEIPKYKNVMAEMSLKNKPYWTIQSCAKNNNVYEVTASLYDLENNLDYIGDGGEYGVMATEYKTGVKLYFDDRTSLSPTTTTEFTYSWPGTKNRYIRINDFYNIIKGQSFYEYLWEFDLDGNYIRRISDNLVNQVN